MGTSGGMKQALAGRSVGAGPRTHQRHTHAQGGPHAYLDHDKVGLAGLLHAEALLVSVGEQCLVDLRAASARQAREGEVAGRT